MKKLIFLDLDGVINCCTADLERLVEMGFSKKYSLTHVSPFAVNRLIEICKRTGAHVVLNATMGPELFFGDAYTGKKGHYCLPDGSRIMDVLTYNNISVDGYAYDRFFCYGKKRVADSFETILRGSKLTAVAMYLSAHPADSFLIVEDDLSFKDDEIKKDVELLARYVPDALPCYDAELFRTHYIATGEADDVCSLPYGLRDCDIEKAVRILSGKHR